MDKLRKLRNLRYSMKKKGYVFYDKTIAIMPEDDTKRSKIQERRIRRLGVNVQYNMFTQNK